MSAADPAHPGVSSATESDDHPAARFGQLTYTSFDAGSSGGWQVKEEIGLAPHELVLLRSRIDAQLDAAVELPRFPSPDQIDAFPRRLVYAGDLALDRASATGAPDAAWWHHAPAGLDGSGRPGNVFTHVLLDRAPEEGPRVRPIQWWRSPGWLTPYGPEAVRDCTLSETPGPGEAVSADTVVSFLLDPAYDRIGVLAALLDGIAAALQGGPAVVLGTRSTDTAALWIAAVSHLTSIPTATRLGFSTLERHFSLGSRLRQGLHLVCVPLVDLERLNAPTRTYLLLGEEDLVASGELGGAPHVTGCGDRVPVTEWSILAKVALLDHFHALTALADVDAWTAELEAQPDEPGWPLALVVAAHPEPDFAFADASGEAARVLVRTSPSGMADGHVAAARALVERQVQSSAGAWPVLEAVAEGGGTISGMGEVVLARYAVLAAGDPAWLAQPGGPPLPAGRWSADWATPGVRAEIAAGIERLSNLPTDDDDTVRAGLGLTRLLTGLGLHDPQLDDLLRQELGGSLAPRLLADGAAGLVDRLAPLPEPVLAGLVRPVVDVAIRQADVPIGHQVARPVLEWLFPDAPTPLHPLANERADTPPAPDDALRGELAFHRCAEDSVRYAPERPFAVYSALQKGVDPGRLLALFAAPWAVEDLHALESRAPGRLPLEVFGPAFKGSAASTPLITLTTLLSARPEVRTGGGVAALIQLRRLQQRRWWELPADGLDAAVDQILRAGVVGLGYPQVSFHVELVELIQSALALAALTGRHDDEIEALARSGGIPRGLTSAHVRTVVVTAAVANQPFHQLAMAALLGDPRFPEPMLDYPALKWVNGIEVDIDGERQPLLRYCAAVMARRLGERAYEPTLKQILDRFWAMLARSDNRERAFRACQRFTGGWLRALFPNDGLLSRLRLGGP